ncbi:hypothetical protein CCR75_002433 [Bremia lactucae]|uniref:tRNA (guanine(26)-N(2))-dimethyltransferase n=1 Tax=Bremia lactucae TaxID=4779 RepID=A0A976ICM8_BRELC|nr:hypothetical protein CCR75_002433 [Bremia lactucae]
MSNHGKSADQFDVTDLDLHISASIFSECATQSITNGGLLCVTCTNMPVLSGKQSEVCFLRSKALSNKSHLVSTRYGSACSTPDDRVVSQSLRTPYRANCIVQH